MKTKQLNKAELKERLYSSRYVVPNAVTVGSMFCGFLTIIYASTARFERAAIAILIAIILDGLDGRVARKLNATSRFGVEFDSFADLISFGVAPALLMYYWCFQQKADEFGVFIGFVYVVCAASRLARFNISSENLDSFTGLPSPASAGMVVAIVFASPVVVQDLLLVTFGSLILLLLGYLMISKVEYLSIKRLKIKTMPNYARLALASLIALIWYAPRIGFLILAGGYVFGCLAHNLWRSAKLQFGATTGSVTSNNFTGSDNSNKNKDNFATNEEDEKFYQ